MLRDTTGTGLDFYPGAADLIGLDKATICKACPGVFQSSSCLVVYPQHFRSLPPVSLTSDLPWLYSSPVTLITAIFSVSDLKGTHLHRPSVYRGLTSGPNRPTPTTGGYLNCKVQSELHPLVCSRYTFICLRMTSSPTARSDHQSSLQLQNQSYTATEAMYLYPALESGVMQLVNIYTHTYTHTHTEL